MWGAPVVCAPVVCAPLVCAPVVCTRGLHFSDLPRHSEFRPEFRPEPGPIFSNIIKTGSEPNQLPGMPSDIGYAHQNAVMQAFIVKCMHSL